MKKTFEQWHAELTALAKAHELSWLIPPSEDYPRDGYEDELTPGDELSELVSAAAS